MGHPTAGLSLLPGKGFSPGSIPGRVLLLFLAVILLMPAVAGAAVLGKEAFSGVLLVEEASEALCTWYREGLRGLPLVHIGARPVFHAPDVDPVTTGEALREALEGQPCGELKGRTSGHLRADSLYTGEDFALAARLLGVVGELWWVVPARQTLPEGELEPFRAWLGETFGLPGEFASSLRYDGSLVRGEWGGLPVRLCTLEDLPSLEGPVILSVDTGFLVKLYENPAREGMLDQLGWFFAALREKRLEGAAVSVSAGGRDTPLAFLYLGGRVKDFLADPGAFTGGPPEVWRRQQQFEYLDFLLAREDALTEAERLAALDPRSPVPWYDRAAVAARRGQAGVAENHLREAVARDSAYARGYVELAEILHGVELKKQSLALLRRGRERHPGDLEIGIVLVSVLGDLGMSAEAAEAAASMAEKNPSVPLLHLVSAAALRTAGRREDAMAAMERFRRTAPPGRWREEVLRDRGAPFPLPGGSPVPFPIP